MKGIFVYGIERLLNGTVAVPHFEGECLYKIINERGSS